MSDATAELPERASSWLELFFDLVFVAAVTALGELLRDRHSLTGLAIFAGLFVPVWWAWRCYTWFASGFDTGDRVFRVSLLLATALAALMASGVAGVADERSSTFVIAYAGLFLLLAALYERGRRALTAPAALCLRYVALYGLGGGLWLVSLAVPESLRPIVWAVAMAVLVGAPLTVLALPAEQRAAYHPGHIAERYGLFTLIVLGESVATTAADLGHLSGAEGDAIALLGFVLAACIWWHYFAHWRPMPGGSRHARNAWAQGHLLIFAGITAAAVGLSFCADAAHAGRPLAVADRLPIGAGLAAYAIAMGLIRWATRGGDRIVALRIAVAAALVAAALAPIAGALGFVAVVTVLLAAMVVLDLTVTTPDRWAVPWLPFHRRR